MSLIVRLVGVRAPSSGKFVGEVRRVLDGNSLDYDIIFLLGKLQILHIFYIYVFFLRAVKNKMKCK